MTMSRIAQQTGIARATLYKYFPDADAVLAAWHERQVHAHLAQLAELRGAGGEPSERREALLLAYALIQHEHQAEGTAALLHQGEHIHRAQAHLHGFVRDLIAEAASAGRVRRDVAPDELATYCLHAVAAATRLPSKAAVRRLVDVTIAGLQPARSSPA